MNLTGSRTLIGLLGALGVLLAGLWLVEPAARGAVYGFFAGAVVGLLSAQVVKSSVGLATNGEGLKGGLENLLTAKKPGDPPPSPPPTP
jgi:hypothetical protein